MAKITIEAIQKVFEHQHIYSAEYLKKHFGCSYQCIWENLKKVGYYSSFTHNSKYYTLANIAEFNDNDIWFHCDPVIGEIGFTKQKTASNLIVWLINSSQTGLTERNLTDIMKIRICNQLNGLVKQSKIQKVKLENKSYYFSIDKNQYRQQYANLTATESLSLDKQSDSCSKEQHYQHRIKRLTDGRASWRKRSNEKQQKIREHLIRIRDLETSRDKWKSAAMKYKSKVQQLKVEIDKIKKNSSMPII
jgi:hypothetical protein